MHGSFQKSNFDITKRGQVTLASLLQQENATAYLEQQFQTNPSMMVGLRVFYKNVLSKEAKKWNDKRVQALDDKRVQALDKEVRDFILSKHDLDNPDVFRVTFPDVSMKFLAAIVEHEKVQPFARRWLFDMARRIGGRKGKENSRAIYAWQDPFDKDMPLIFIEVAFTKGPGTNIQQTVDVTDEFKGKADTATFYSINSCGILPLSLGEKFIFAVAKKIKETNPDIKFLCTQSPMPNFKDWVVKSDGFTQEKLDNAGRIAGIKGPMTVADFRKEISEIKDTETLRGNDNKETFETLKRLSAIYITGGILNEDRFKAFDSVANFHMANGAEAGQLLFEGDNSKEGFGRSFGFMINYFYKIDDVLNNQKAFNQGKPQATLMVRMLSGNARPWEKATANAILLTKSGYDSALAAAGYAVKAASRAANGAMAYVWPSGQPHP